MTRNRTLARFLVLLWMCVSAGPLIAAERVVSINMCADQLLLALAEPGQIAGLSPYAGDTRLSFMADQAGDHRAGIGTAEQVVQLDPDLVIAGRFTRRATRDMLSRLGYEVMLLDPARSIDESIAQIGTVAARLGAHDKGAAMIADIRAAMSEASVSADDGPSAAIYQRRGWVTGGATLSEELLALAGLANHGAALAPGRGGFVTLEHLVRTPPDVLVVADDSPTADDQGSALLAHPALNALFPPERRLVLPERLTVCGGPSLPAAIRWLTSEAERLQLR